jgi:hypothetical protein
MTALLNEAGEVQYKVLVAVPCGDSVKAGFAQDLALMLAYTTFVRPAMEVRLAFLRGTYLPRARAGLVADAYEYSCTHVLWLDADMRFPKDTLIRLLSHEKPIVAANYPTRQPPIIATAVDEERNPIFGGDGLFEARGAGMGCMLTSIDVFDAIGKPYFALGYSRDADDYSGEDLFFCEKARASNFAIWIDGPLSEQVKHIGEFAFGMDHARMTLEAARGAH